MTNSPDVQSGVRPGDVLAGKYRVERVLGIGGMGVVVAAHHIQLDEKVALKFLLPEALLNPEAVGRFVREARAAVKIKGEHVARVSDVGQLPNGSPYIVMEYLEGIDLAAWLKDRGPLPIDLAVDFVLQTCEAIANAHSLGIVHRDLKPANLFCVQRPDGQLSIKVLDFGISKFTAPGAAGHEMTRTNALVGSPFYMSPEQIISSKNVDLRTDIWSLGIILFELLSAHTPFAAEAVTELAVRITIDAAASVRIHRSEVPAGLEAAIFRCLAKERELRFQNVAELAMALKDFGTRRASQSVEAILGTLRIAGPIAAPPGFAPPPRDPSAPSYPPARSSGSQLGAHGGAPTSASWGHTEVIPKGPHKALGVGIAAAFVILLGAGVGVWRITRHDVVPTVAAASGTSPSPSVPAQASADLPSAVLTEPSSSPAPSGSATALNPPPATATTTAPPPATVHPAATLAVVHPGPPPPLTVVVPPPPSPLPPGKIGCNPPYEFDVHGEKKWKRQCL
jgi:serine/threonine protein kinase